MNKMLRGAGVLVSFLVIVLSARAQIITTIAGTGSASATAIGDGGPATSASFNYPFGVALDDSGNVYIADAFNHRIRKVTTATGIISTIAGTGISGFSGDGGPATGAQISYPAGVASDGQGNVYIADFGNNRIRKIASGTGIITTIAGTGAASFSGDGGPATNAHLYYPYGVALDGSGNVYIPDLYNQRIRKITAATGIIATIAGTGTKGFSGDGGPATGAQLDSASGVAVDATGNVYIADRGNNRIRKIAAATGIITTIAGTGIYGFSGDGGAAANAQLKKPYGVAVDKSGNVFIADDENDRIRRTEAATGIITTIAGTGNNGYSGDGGAATDAQLNFPTGMAADSSGNIYIADKGNNRIRKISRGTPTAVPGVPTGWENTLSVFPSPCNGHFTIAATAGASHSGERVQIALINSLGQRVYSSETTSAGAQWSMPVDIGAPNGVYQLSVSIGTMVAVRRLVIER